MNEIFINIMVISAIFFIIDMNYNNYNGSSTSIIPLKSDTCPYISPTRYNCIYSNNICQMENKNTGWFRWDWFNREKVIICNIANKYANITQIRGCPRYIKDMYLIAFHEL